MIKYALKNDPRVWVKSRSLQAHFTKAVYSQAGQRQLELVYMCLYECINTCVSECPQKL